MSAHLSHNQNLLADSPEPVGNELAYAAKDSSYFAGARTDIINQLPEARDHAILEIGCGNGGTGAMALAAGKCGAYCGVELFSGAAAEAARTLSEVVVGDVEKVEIRWKPATFDALILSEVLEHLVDPHAVLKKLRPLLKPGALVFASSPNVAHYEFITMLLRGEWREADFGPNDRTHLRWFTPRSYRRLFENCGYVVDEIASVAQPGWKAKAFIGLTLGRGFPLVTRQIMLRGKVA